MLIQISLNNWIKLLIEKFEEYLKKIILSKCGRSLSKACYTIATLRSNLNGEIIEAEEAWLKWLISDVIWTFNTIMRLREMKLEITFLEMEGRPVGE